MVDMVDADEEDEDYDIYTWMSRLQDMDADA